MSDRLPHPRAHTHGDDYEKDLLDRILTELEGLRDDFAIAFPAPVTVAAEPVARSAPIAVDIQEPAIPGGTSDAAPAPAAQPMKPIPVPKPPVKRKER